MAEKNTIAVRFGSGASGEKSASTGSGRRPRERTLSGGANPFAEGHVGEVPVEKLQSSLRALTGQLETLLKDIHKVGGYRLKQVEVTAEITAEGGIALLAEVKAGAKGAIQLTFEPAP